jgi:hypothetical protein
MAQITIDYQHKDLTADDVQGIHDFIVDADIVDGPDELYAIVQQLWPELLHKVKPPRSLMHWWASRTPSAQTAVGMTLRASARDSIRAAHLRLWRLSCRPHDESSRARKRGSSMTKAHEEKKDLDGKDKSQGDLVDGGELKTLEGLRRERKGPLDKDVGRKND